MKKYTKKSPVEIQAMITGFENITKKITKNKWEFIRLSETDEPTGTYESTHIYGLNETEVERAYEEQTRLSIAFIDIDFSSH